ncbi:uncharacterized protein LOC110178186 isoform X2 [Drosophila serrata]|uniref:uncharacterized protein LOC110178186 isoform X2 n=1 Tax=Drosophila serrata TaxID=7274 RepID=UPI000A1D0179|nr:uncharacterized protein LOC110178186 isoform X2 [Drosophila serrata]
MPSRMQQRTHEGHAMQFLFCDILQGCIDDQDEETIIVSNMQNKFLRVYPIRQQNNRKYK